MRKSVVTLTVLSTMLAACGMLEQQPAPVARAGGAKGDQQQLNFKLACGVYGCESGQQIEVLRDGARIEVNWRGTRYTLQRYDSASGLPRYEDQQHGLLWIDLPWKSVLMDANSGRPLANECKAIGT